MATPVPVDDSKMAEIGLHQLCNTGDIDEVKAMLAKGDVDIDACGGILAMPSLCWASRAGYMGIVELLLENGADVSKCGTDGVTALHYAIQSTNELVARCLISNGSDVNALDAEGNSIAAIACSRGVLNIVDFLVEKGADLSLANVAGRAPIHRAATNGHVSTVARCLIQEMDSSCTDKEGNTPLHLAARCGFDLVARELLKGGANSKLKNKLGNLPADLIPEFMQTTGNVFADLESMDTWESKVHLRRIRPTN